MHSRTAKTAQPNNAVKASVINHRLYAVTMAAMEIRVVQNAIYLVVFIADLVCV